MGRFNQWLIRYDQKAVLRELIDEAVGVALRLFLIDIELLADFGSNDFSEWRASIRCLPNRRSNLIESEESGICSRHDHHFAAQHAGSDRLAWRNVFLSHYEFR